MAGKLTARLTRTTAIAFESMAPAPRMRKDEMEKRSKESAKMFPYLTKAADLVDGTDAVKGKTTEYLPKFVNESMADYDERLSLARYTNIISDIIENLASKPFEKEVVIVDAPEALEAFQEDVDGSGNNLTHFAYDTFFNGIQYAIDWIFVDFPTVEQMPGRVRTRAEEKQLGIKPFWSHVLAVNVWDAQWKVINGKEVLTYIKIFEPGSGEDVDQYRIMKRDANGAVFEIWRLTETRDEYMLFSSGPLTIGVIPMEPFATGRRSGRTYYYKPPMKASMDLQVELYQQESGNKFIRNISAYPMLSGDGVRPELQADGKTPVPLAIGPMRSLYAPMDGQGNHGTWKFLQPEAGLLNYLKDDAKDTAQQLRELGRQPLTANSGNLTVITTAVAAGKAKSAVSAWAGGLKNALENALVFTLMWMNISKDSYDPEVEVYTEFDDFTDPTSDLDTLNTMREGGDLSQKTYWSEMKRRKVLSDNFNADDEVKAILKETPVGEDEYDENGNLIKPVNKEPPA